MEESLNYKKGDVVVINFPFSDSEETKKRPSLVVSKQMHDTLILCQITSQMQLDNNLIQLSENDFLKGSLNQLSSIRPSMIFTMHSAKINYRIGTLKQEKIKAVENAIVKLFTD